MMSQYRKSCWGSWKSESDISRDLELPVEDLNPQRWNKIVWITTCNLKIKTTFTIWVRKLNLLQIFFKSSNFLHVHCLCCCPISWGFTIPLPDMKWQKTKKKSYYLKTANSSWSVQPPNLQWCVRACEGFWRHCGQDVDTWCSLDLNLWSKIEMLQWKFLHTCSISGVGTLNTNQQGHAGFEGVWGAAFVFEHSTSLPSHTCTLQLRRVCNCCGHGVDSPGCRCCMARPALLLIALPAPALLLIGLRAAATVLYSPQHCLLPVESTV